MNLWAVVLLAAGVVASCARFPSSQQPVQSSNPSVTYNYRTDQELIEANQRATTYCSQYQTAAGTANITNTPDGSKAVRFECVRTTLPAPAPRSQSYTYRTDQELLQVSQTAGTYCRTYGAQPMTSRIVTNPDGTKTVTFQVALVERALGLHEDVVSRVSPHRPRRARGCAPPVNELKCRRGGYGYRRAV